MKIKDRLLFLKYALPCAGTLVGRGVVPQSYVDRLVAMVSENKVPRDDAESVFKVANMMCTSIAQRMGKKSIDAEVIRTYFLLEHNKVVEDRFEIMGDFNPVDCKTYVGRIVKENDGLAVVETILGKRGYKTVFARDVKKNDKVAVHFDFIIEKLSDEMAEKMNGR